MGIVDAFTAETPITITTAAVLQYGVSGSKDGAA